MADNVKIEIDTTDVQGMFDRMERKVLRPAWKKAFRKAGNVIVKNVRQTIKQRWPGGKRKDSGVLRNIQYGPLYKDVNMNVYKSGEGVNVNIFSNRKRTTRWCVLYWLNQGTSDRTAYIRRGKKKPAGRGALAETNFFGRSAKAVANQAQEEVARAIPNAVEQSANKQLNK